MKSSWLNGLDKDQQKEIRREFATNKTFREHFIKVLAAKEDEVYRCSFATKNYNSPNWAYEQADRAGYVRALRLVQDILKDDKV